MSWQDHKNTIVTNIVQQSTAIPIFLVVPNLLSIEGYGQIVFVGVLLSFMGFSDLGWSLVYGRKMPSIYANGNIQEILTWNQTTYTFRLYTALLFGVVIGFVYWLKYKELLNVVLLFLVPLLSVFTSFYLAQKTSLGDFVIYRKTNNFLSIARLSVVPGVMFFGVVGWFISQVVANLLTIFTLPRKFWWPEKLIVDFSLLKAHIFEGVRLGAITMLWSQLLISSKVFSSLMYPDEVVAQYGLINAGYQIVGGLVISAFIPQTIKVYKMMEGNPRGAIEYIFATILYATPAVFVLAVISREAAPFALSYLFPKYNIDTFLLDAVVLSLPVYPILVTLGAVLVAQEKSTAYFFLLALLAILNWIIIICTEPIYGYGAAAIAQFITLFVYSASLLALVYYFSWKNIEHKASSLMKICGSLLGSYAAYYFIKSWFF